MRGKYKAPEKKVHFFREEDEDRTRLTPSFPNYLWVKYQQPLLLELLPTMGFCISTGLRRLFKNDVHLDNGSAWSLRTGKEPKSAPYKPRPALPMNTQRTTKLSEYLEAHCQSEQHFLQRLVKMRRRTEQRQKTAANS